MKITRKQLQSLISDNLQLNESASLLLFNLLTGCTGIECNLHSLANIPKDTRIPDCVRHQSKDGNEIYLFDDLSWEAGVDPYDLQRIAQDEGYEVDMRSNTVGWADQTAITMSVIIKNVPQIIVKHLSEIGVLEPPEANSDLRDLKDDRLCNLILQFPRVVVDDKEIVCKNRGHFGYVMSENPEQYTDFNDYYVGYSIIEPADLSCDAAFKRVVDNIDPDMIPDEDTGI